LQATDRSVTDSLARYGSAFSVLSLGIVSIVLMGCTHSLSASPDPAPAASPAAMSLGQSLPLSAQVQVGNQVIFLEVAQTPAQQQQGLMYRESLAGDRGMVFPFNPPRRVGFWMKNVSINLDMIFVRAGKVVAIGSQIPPCTTEPCAVYGPAELVDQVVELRGGRAAELGLKVGDRFVVAPKNTLTK
jgi:uncharacterized protein